MPLRYKYEFKNELLPKLNEKGYSTVKIREQGLLSQSTLQKLRDKEGIDWKNIETLCYMLDCQPGDLIEFEKTEEDDIAIQKKIEKAAENAKKRAEKQMNK